MTDGGRALNAREVVAFDLEVARVHAALSADLRTRGVSVGGPRPHHRRHGGVA